MGHSLFHTHAGRSPRVDRLYHDDSSLRAIAASKRPYRRLIAPALIACAFACSLGMALLRPAVVDAMALPSAPMQQSDESGATDAPALSVDLNGLNESLNQGRGDVQGRTAPGALLEIFLNEELVTTATASPSGDWRANVDFGGPGARELLILARNETRRLIGVFGPIAIVVPEAGSDESEEEVRIDTPVDDETVPEWHNTLETMVTPSPTPETEEEAAPAQAATAVQVTRSAPAATPTPDITPAPASSPAPMKAAAPEMMQAEDAVCRPMAAAPRSRPQRGPATDRPMNHQMAAPLFGTVKLISPEDMVSGQGRRTFSWEANCTLPSHLAYELIFWKKNQDPLEDGFGLAPPTRATSISVDLNGLDHALGNLLQPGLYNWGVLIVQESPYQRIAFAGGTNQFRFDRTYGHAPDAQQSVPAMRAVQMDEHLYPRGHLAQNQRATAIAFTHVELPATVGAHHGARAFNLYMDYDSPALRLLQWHG